MWKLTKITTTIGPTSQSPEMLEKLYEAGTNMCRLNFSHDSQEVQGMKLKTVRDISKKLGRPIAVLADMQGPKHRIGEFKDGQASGINKKYPLVPGQKFTLDSDPTPGDETRVQLPDPDVMKSLKVGDRVLVNDGKIELKVTAKKGDSAIETEVVRGSEIWDRRGFNLPDTEIKASILTKKDRSDLEFVLPLDPDFVAISFVQTAEDVIEARKFIEARTKRPVKIISKLERPQVVGDRLEAIVEASDVIMVARGDLAVEMPFEKVPAAQRKMIRICRAKNKPVIVATQMLGSMEKGLFPTRAEISDIATAGYLLADSTMTSEETTMGLYPVETTSAMARTLRATEEDILENELDESDGDFLDDENSKFDTIMGYAESEDAAAVVSLDDTGDQTRRLSARKSYLPIVSISRESIIANQLCLSRGVFPMVGETWEDAVKSNAGLKKGDKVVVVSGNGDKISIKTL
ncbi:MAG: pyruvate kinase [Rickettsiales bacterium]|jgi:pyruvate kinase|nr:pyruvate kinase [Rickettsiales bacterium]